MKDFIFEFEQEKVVQLNLKLKELVLLEYMFKFFKNEEIKTKDKVDKFYCRLSYKQVLNDLPILRIKERQLRNLIIGLEQKGIIERFSELKNQAYLFVDWEKLFALPQGRSNLYEIHTLSGQAATHKNSRNQKSKINQNIKLKFA